ncbi:MAG: ATP-binding protein [Caldiserica bacterium]|jgi:two-component system sensor histidine kinase AtoS|nr:ATP-binding protein [Caldisericota bacterium]MDH7562101.1 ATP-binding protein [Caldisericota bacterium]
MKKFLTLRNQLFLLIAILVLTMLIGAAFFLTNQAQKALLEEKIDKVTGITQQMAIYYEQVISRLSSDPQFNSLSQKDQRKVLEEELSKFTSILNQAYPNIFYGYFIGEYGAPIAYKSTPQPGLSWITDAQITNLVRDGEIVGYAFAMEDRSVVQAQLAQIRNVSIGMTVALTLLGAIGAFILGTNLSRGVVGIKGGLKRMESDLSYRLPRYSGEIGEIAEAVNRLGSALVEARDYTRFVLENISTGILSLNENGEITVFNPAAEKLLGINASEAVGSPYETVIMKSNIPQKSKIISLIRDHQEGEQAVVISTLKPEPIELGVSISSLLSSEGTLSGKIITIEDLSMRRKLEELLRRSDRLAALGLFLSGIAHEVRNPLTSIKGFVQLLISRNLILPEGAKAANLVIKEADRLNKLLTDLLTFASPAPPRIEKRDIREIIERSVSLLEEQIAKQGIKVEKKISGIPPLEIDEQKLEQVFYNILLNGVQAMPEGGTLKIESRLSEEEVEIAFSDSGPGIPEEHLDKIFDPFFTTKDRGTGLGLAVSHRMIEALGGKIEVQSRRGEGATFIVHLPLGREET